MGRRGRKKKRGNRKQKQQNDADWDQRMSTKKSRRQKREERKANVQKLIQEQLKKLPSGNGMPHTMEDHVVLEAAIRSAENKGNTTKNKKIRPKTPIELLNDGAKSVTTDQMVPL